MTLTAQETFERLKQTLSGYIEATYHIGHPAIVAQRRALLERPQGIYQEPFLESTPRYQSGSAYSQMIDVPAAAIEAYIRLSRRENGEAVLFDPPYSHQEQAIREILAAGRNAMIMTGTGSGKTESFLLPILGKLAIEARTRPNVFRTQTAMRAIVLYPMNALVNDQLGRLRLLFGSHRVRQMFEEWAGRPARFARYTSRTPYAGLRSRQKDQSRLTSIGDFFAGIERAAARGGGGESARARDLLSQLQQKGKWPAKESVAEWFGAPGEHWQNGSGDFQRAVLGVHDSEMLTRHEAQKAPPDLLITNYSMLEYMMMRPIERPLFDRTRDWLAANPSEKILIVLDEAHLYRGAQGAEVGLLLRRLRDRLHIPVERFQVICASASFSEAGRQTAGEFGAQLTGAPPDSFALISGELARRAPAASGTDSDAVALSAVDYASLFSENVEEQAGSVASFLAYRGVVATDNISADLYHALQEFSPFNELVNVTMSSAQRVTDLPAIIFPQTSEATRRQALSVLLALGSRARRGEGEASLLPCRLHTFLRGLPGLWACMDPDCGDLPAAERSGVIGKLYGQPRFPRCTCNAPVLEYFTCRLCGASYARAYTNDVTNPLDLWGEPGRRLLTEAGLDESYQPLDLLLEPPSSPDLALAAFYDLRTGQLNPIVPSDRVRTVYLRHQPQDQKLVDPERGSAPGQFVPCGCCGRKHGPAFTTVQDHQTKGDQPFQAVLNAQIQAQPPSLRPATEFAPLRGRKSLVFSDSRQMAARLAPNLQSLSLRDTVRTLLPIGYRLIANDPIIAPSLNLDHAVLAVIVAAHVLGVRVRPILDAGEDMPRFDAPIGQMPTTAEMVRVIGEACPANLMADIREVIQHENFGLEPLAVASVAERPNLTQRIHDLPDIPGVATTPSQKEEIVRAWLRLWFKPGIWFQKMPPSWWGTKVGTHEGNFSAMDKVLVVPRHKTAFRRDWLDRLKQIFTIAPADGGRRILASNMTLLMGGEWVRCPRCKSVHRPIETNARCIDCGMADVQLFDPETDPVFRARRGFYRDPVVHALNDRNAMVVSLIAAEHTAQLNAAQPEDAFSAAEDHELRFQDINIAWRDTDRQEPAIDVLSSTTTMEVGIDIGELSAVALRNMPPARANYQQRAGRAGRRGTAIATVVAFGSVDSHDDHYFVAPEEMIRGPVLDPRLALENADIARRHIRAFLLQRYHEFRIPGVDPGPDPRLFSVLGSVADFRHGTGVLNRADFANWLNDNRQVLRQAADNWLPHQLSGDDRSNLIDGMFLDVLAAIDEAIGLNAPDDAEPLVAAAEPAGDAIVEEGDDGEEENSQVPEDDERIDPATDKLLDRLLYKGVLPRYAFPTDVAPFYVFNKARSTPFRPKMDFAPSQGLNIALSQYAPNKQIWIKDKQYTSKAIYSPYTSERRDAWRRKRIYFECSHCHHAETEENYDENVRGTILACRACQSPTTFGPARTWLRPPGFAHPITMDPLTTPEEPNETAYATRAKLVMPTPAPDEGWIAAGPRVRAFATRRHLLVSNTGPKNEGYHYCTSCGRIESAADPQITLTMPHTRPFLSDEDGDCPGDRVARNIVLGTDFITDIALFSIPLEDPFRLRPGNDETHVALRSVCEAIARAAGTMLQIEVGEVLAEYRPALTPRGALGHEVEIFVYDTLAGGAGFASQLAQRADQLFAEAQRVLTDCPENCDSSCYRCLRSFRNKLDHKHLDRIVGAQLIRHARSGGYPEFDGRRFHSSISILEADLRRQLGGDFAIERDALRTVTGTNVVVPIVVRRNATGAESWITLHSPCAGGTPIDPGLRSVAELVANLICIDDLRVRQHLPSATDQVRASLA
ncbi:MAG TPA: DEAD/DEAH box helicase [Hyphomonas sp.]|nr:DEAD/DEAH box helicase [Hyphomonas sp.]HRX73035.1 DEAD/DEAH box helicase [Hyphomonas sp.]